MEGGGGRDYGMEGKEEERKEWKGGENGGRNERRRGKEERKELKACGGEK